MSSAAEVWQDALTGARLLALSPENLGGVLLRAPAGPVRDCWLEQVQSLRPDLPRFAKIPVSVSESRLLGGLDLVRTLTTGRAVFEPGVLARGHGQILLLLMAERCAPTTVSQLCAVLDSGCLRIAREGIEAELETRFGLIALDESMDDEAGVADKLCDRLAIHLDLRAVGFRDLDPVEDLDRDAILARAAQIPVDDRLIGAVCAAAAAFGVHDIRTAQHVVRVVKLLAAMRGGQAVSEDDLGTALRLCVLNRARCVPSMEHAGEEDAADTQPPPTDPPETSDDEAEASSTGEPDAMHDRLVDAMAAALPPDLLRALQAGSARGSSATTGRSGELRKSLDRGRPVGSMPGDPRRGGRIDVTATLLAAAPWQRLRRAAAPHRIGVLLRPEDFRIRRYREPAETTIIFAVDASGSSAMHRLAEVKGAIELLLADCYVRRDEVALVVFKGQTASLLLPPTRSLVRAKRELQALPGGGGTPLAAGLELATTQADLAQRRGSTPVVVVMTDGRANISRDGSQGREQAHEESLLAGRQLARLGVSAILIDTSMRADQRARRVADAMHARYVVLPRADAHALKNTVSLAVS